MTETLRDAAVAVALVLGFVACEPLDPVPPPDARIEVVLTDAAVTYLDTAEVDLGAVELVAADGSVVTLTDDGTSGPVDLLDLEDDRFEQLPRLADADVPQDEYARLRLVVESMRVELARGYAFTDGTTARELAVPSGAAAGLALNLDVAGMRDDDVVGAMDIQAGRTVLVLDFDVNQSLALQGDPESIEGIEGIVFTPAIRVVVREEAGSIAGTVRAAAAGAEVEGLTVTALPLDEGALEAYQTRTATATTGADGSYTLRYMGPGGYAVSVAADSGYTADPTATQVRVDEAQETTGVDFDITAAGGV